MLDADGGRKSGDNCPHLPSSRQAVGQQHNDTGTLVNHVRGLTRFGISGFWDVCPRDQGEEASHTILTLFCGQYNVSSPHVGKCPIKFNEREVGSLHANTIACLSLIVHLHIRRL